MGSHGTVVLLLVIVLLLSSHMCHGQHWSFGLRPGGKREVESLQDSYAEVPNEVSFTEPQHLECSIPQSRLSLVREALREASENILNALSKPSILPHLKPPLNKRQHQKLNEDELAGGREH